ncbi:hypothetical protein LCL95_02575 [Bacillus timonensis]|nr:hypothetical protein [Bacillus timonensis]
MIGKTFRCGLLIGFISGIVLAVFLKSVEIIFSIKVYTLLLNVDFIPIIGSIKWSELVELTFHLFISILIGIIYCLIVTGSRFARFKWKKRISYYFVALLLTFPTIFLYFPLTILAYKETPEINDWVAFSWWTIGHILYSLSLSYFYIRYKK